MISNRDKIINIKGKIQMNKGVCILKKSFLSKYLPRNNRMLKATAHCEAKPANFVH
jgi:hypothetical protein